MVSISRPNFQDSYTKSRNLKWSTAEKAIARRAFDRSLQRELEAVIRDAKSMAMKMDGPHELWELEYYLTRRRKEIDRQYDYRYSMFIFVFADLIRKGRLREEELRGLTEDKLRYIRSNASL